MSSGSISSCFGPASTVPATQASMPGLRATSHGALGVVGGHEEREAGAHVERAVGLAVVVLGVLLDERQHRRHVGHRCDAVA